MAPEFGNLRYRSIGPAIAGGRTTAVVGSDRDPLVYYAGGAGGGVFKSIDGGASWNPLFDRESSAAIGAIAIAPGDANDVWVGTGESNPRNDVESGDGVWHSADGGKTWTHLGLEDAGQISSISIDPRNPSFVVVGVLGQVFADSTARGVYVTHDAGRHWTRALYVGPSSGVSDLARMPGRPNTMFAGVYQFRREPWAMHSGGPDGGIYRSDDAGVSWRKLDGHGLPPAPTGRIGLAAGNGGRIYAIIQSAHGEIWRSDDWGRTWTVMPHSPFVGARPFYFSRVFVDPADRNRVIDVGLVLSLSTDGAKTFKAIATNAGWDYHAAWWSGDGRRIAVATDEGLILSGDGSANFWQPYDLPFAQPYHVGFGSTVPNYEVCIGLQDDSSWCGWSSVYNGIGVLNRDWSTIGPGDGMWALVDPTDSNLTWSTSTNDDTGQVYVFDRRTQQAYEVSPVARYNSRAPSDLQYRFNWDTPIAFTAGPSPQVLTAGNVVFQSADRGQHWRVISPDLTRDEKSHQQASGKPIDQDVSGAETSDTILDIEPSKIAAGQIWVGTDDGLVQLTRDGGDHWTNVSPPNSLPWGRFATVEAGHFAPGTAYAALDRHMLGDNRPYVFATGDFGATWHSIASNLPAGQFVRSVREDLKNGDILYAGTQRGVWISFDRGGHWNSLRLNMPATAVYDLELQPAMDDLLVASHGRGAWALDDLASLRELGRAQAIGLTLFAPRDAYRMWQWSPINSFSGGQPDNEFVGENPAYGALIDYYLPKVAAHPPTLEILDAQGRTVRHVDPKELSNLSGINRASWDLAEDGPVKWTGTFKLNQGPDVGAEVVPGTYTIRLTVDGRTQSQPLTVRADPRDPGTPERYARRHDFLHGLMLQIGTVDTMLDHIDARLKTATPSQAAALRAFQRELTLNPRNVEDLAAPPGLREELMDLATRVGSTSFQAPTAAQMEEAARLAASYQVLTARYAALK